MIRKKKRPKATSTPILVLADRAAPARPALDIDEAVTLLRATDIAALKNPAKMFLKVPHVELSPRMPVVDGRGYVNFFGSWDWITPVESPFSGGYATCVGVGYSRVQIQLRQLSPTDTYVVAVDVATWNPTQWKVDRDTGPTMLVAATTPVATSWPTSGYQTLLIVIQPMAAQAWVEIGTLPAVGWGFIQAKVWST